MTKISKRAALRRYKSLQMTLAPNWDELSEETQARIFAKICLILSRDERRALGLKTPTEQLRDVAS